MKNLAMSFIVEPLEFNRYMSLFSSFNKSILGPHFVTRSKDLFLSQYDVSMMVTTFSMTGFTIFQQHVLCDSH